ncbi:hypothetical protein SAMN05444171_8081 [Bradyrhizobium lablabi]|uniref:Uncharacterized protein n=1 Tax=Bradyrhizobium lablabi TaxID=722472 RepID=A0A1H5JJ47_9BRAD|nr:hypothetical protein SAMN05444171_7857 [Bradyrhizobium lablabi]SEE79291.1 hypothetical protein SAMN05444171_8081 [Bradyrhizobium lablabi]
MTPETVQVVKAICATIILCSLIWAIAWNTKNED